MFDGRGVMTDSELYFLKDSFIKAKIDEFKELLSQSKIGFLIGAGCSKCAGLPLTTELTKLVTDELSDIDKKLITSIIGNFEGAGSPTIEDFLSEIIDFLAILERRTGKGAINRSISISDTEYSIDQLKATLDHIKQLIAKCIGNMKPNLTTHQKFIENIHHRLRSGKEGLTYPVDYFLLNYDTLIEDALAHNKIDYVDGFKGGAHGWWDSETFSTSSTEARVIKLHGSIDWCALENEDLPRRIRKVEFSNESSVLIWPASTKYKETQKDPYVQMISIFRNALKSALSNPTILAICGYRFQDSHINTEIEKALLSKENLTLLIFTELEKPEDILERWNTTPLITGQVRIHSKRGFFHNGESHSVDFDIPWWNFEELTKLLGGER